MLALTRMTGDHIVIGDPATDGCIVVTCVWINGSKVRLGVSAPPAVQIWRHEVLPRLDHVHPSLLKLCKEKL